tara:strand:- start:337 stop:591 length:255 start_codon:yes stop_codon:yes gene_type:complete
MKNLMFETEKIEEPHEPLQLCCFCIDIGSGAMCLIILEAFYLAYFFLVVMGNVRNNEVNDSINEIFSGISTSPACGVNGLFSSN